MKKILIIIMLGLQLTYIAAQETIATAGGNAFGTGGSASYTVGQTAYVVDTGAGGTSSQGVQQPYEIYVVTETGKAKILTLTCSAGPNPTTDYLVLKTSVGIKEKFLYAMYDTGGKMLMCGENKDNETTIDVSDLPPATYFLSITQNNIKVKIFKIIKN